MPKKPFTQKKGLHMEDDNMKYSTGTKAERRADHLDEPEDSDLFSRGRIVFDLETSTPDFNAPYDHMDEEYSRNYSVQKNYAELDILVKRMKSHSGEYSYISLEGYADPNVAMLRGPIQSVIVNDYFDAKRKTAHPQKKDSRIIIPLHVFDENGFLIRTSFVEQLARKVKVCSCDCSKYGTACRCEISHEIFVSFQIPTILLADQRKSTVPVEDLMGSYAEIEREE
jgi:hypothetical protein